MMPMYKDSPQPCQMRPQGCYHHQGYGNNLHRTTMDALSPCYGNCVHGNFPSCNAYWPPYHHPQVPCHQCYVNHPGFHPPQASYAPPCSMCPSFPVGYQQPWYASEKDVPGKHHCGNCSQTCIPRNNRGIVIEEHEPEIEKENKGEAVLPVWSTNCPYPIIWIPHENARNKWSEDHEQPTAEVKAPENMTVQKSDPKSWYGYFPFDESTTKSLLQNQDEKNAQNGETGELPFDISKLKSLLQGRDMKETQIQKNKEEPGQLPFPIFWIPSHGKQENVEASESKNNCNEAHNLKSLASDLHGNDSRRPQKEGKEGKIDRNILSDAKEKSSTRNILVQSRLQEPRDVPVKLSEKQLPKPTEPTKKIVKNEPVGDTKIEHSSTSPKASRLPPVCLRVDPLPKKRNHGSKSLSPRRQKDGSSTSEETKVLSPLHSKKAVTKTVPEVRNVKCEETNKEVKMSEGHLDGVRTDNNSVDKCSNLQEESNSETVRPCETVGKSEKPAKKTFTEEEAAKIIQSRYRGYDVRRWETLKKLKEIATVREQMGDVQKRIKALEISTDQQIEEKEIVIVGEMVMNLLLKLDSVQGLHRSIRDYRKSLARKLSDIEEKLDSLKKNSTVSSIAEEETVKGQADITEKVLLQSPEEHSMDVVDRTDEQPVAEAEEGTRLVENLLDLELATDRAICELVPTSTTAQETGEVKILELNDPTSADGNGWTMTNCGEDKAALESLEESLHKLPQVEQTTQGLGLNATEVIVAEANTSENEDAKGDNDPLLVSGKDVELSELPVGVIDDETQPLPLGQLLRTCEAEVAAMVPETVSKEKTDVDISCDNSEDVVQETSKPQEEKEQLSETEVIVKEQPLETLDTEAIMKEQLLETEVTEHEISEETKKLMEENQRFKETVETLVKAGREQLQVISKLTGRVKSLEKKLSQKKKRTRIGHRKPYRPTKPMAPNLTEPVV